MKLSPSNTSLIQFPKGLELFIFRLMPIQFPFKEKVEIVMWKIVHNRLLTASSNTSVSFLLFLFVSEKVSLLFFSPWQKALTQIISEQWKLLNLP